MGRFFRSTYNVAGWLPLFLVNPGLCFSPQAPTYRVSGDGGLLTNEKILSRLLWRNILFLSFCGI